MNKKFLSAILFGAFMVTSTGTFVSCKDYDDEIDDLQQQIDTVVKDLADLKSQIGDKGVTSVSFDEATGVLTVVDGTGSKTYTIKVQAPDVEIPDVKEVEIKIDGKDLVVNGEVIGQVGDKVTMENGQLVVNGVATDLKVGQYAILDNQNAGTVTITLPDANGNLQTVELMKSSAALTAVQFEDETKATFGGFSTGDILWQKSLKANPDWKGSKGAVTRNQLLIGQISTIDVQVTPSSYALDGQTLTLADSRGNVAPVIITAVPNNRLMPQNRSVSASGSWTLYATIDQTKVNTSNIVDVFDYDKDETTRRSLGYALCVNGNPYTSYDIAVNTNNSESNYPVSSYVSVLGSDLQFIDKAGRVQNVADATSGKLPVGTTNFFIAKPELYDFYLTFEKTNKSLAEQYGIKITEDGRGVIIPAGAEGVNITVTVHTMGINGCVAPSTGTSITNEVGLNIVGSEVATETLATTKHVISANNTLKEITVDFGDVFSKFPAAAREAVRSGNAYLVVETDATQEGFFIATDDVTSAATGVTYKKVIDVVDNSGSKDGERTPAVIELLDKDEEDWLYGDDDMLDLRYMKLQVNVATLNPKATPGTYNLTFKAVERNSGSAVSGNELIKVTVPVEISTPTFADLFNYTGNWNDAKTEYTTKLSINNLGRPALLLGEAFSQKATGAKDSQIQLLYSLIGKESPFAQGTEVVTDGVKYIKATADQLMELKTDVIYDLSTTPVTTLKNSELKVKAYYDLFKDQTGISSPTFDALREAFAVQSDDITVKLQRALEGISAAYYVNGAATNNVTLLTGQEILAGVSKDGKPYNGLFFSLDGDDLSVGYSTWNTITSSGTAPAITYTSTPKVPELAGYEVKPLFRTFTPLAVGEIGVTFTDEDNSLTYKWDTFSTTSGITENIIVSGWRANLGSTNVVIEFQDATGMKYIMSPITLVKAKN